MKPIQELKVVRCDCVDDPHDRCDRAGIEGLTTSDAMIFEDAEAVLLALKAHAALRAQGLEFVDTAPNG